MIIFKKELTIACALFFMVMGLPVEACNERDEFGRTVLMQYVCVQETTIAAIKADIGSLWDNCYEYHREWTGHDFIMVVSYNMDCDIQALKDREACLVQSIQETLEGIDKLVAQGADLAGYDNAGRTVLNYCYTYEIYAALIAHGVPFQYGVCAYFNPELTIVGVCGAIALTLYIKSLSDRGCFSADSFAACKHTIVAALTPGFNECKNHVPTTSEIVDCCVVQSKVSGEEIFEEMTAQ